MGHFPKDDNFFHTLVNAIPVMILLMDSGGAIHAINNAGKNLLNVTDEIVYLRKSGEVFNCIHAINSPEGCGSSDFCKYCKIRQTAMEALQGNCIKRAKGILTVEINGILKDLHLLISASPLDYLCKKFALVTLEDTSIITELNGILPICANCKNIRDDKGGWNSIETYISEHSEAKFTHGICPHCIKLLYPNYYEKIIGSVKTKL